MRFRFLFSFFFCVATLNLQSQELMRDLSISVSELGEELSNAWAGGLNYAQYSKIDLNADGKEDLFIFDRSTYKILTFLNISDEGEIAYDYAPEYEGIFPEGLKNWILLRDYNCDGLKDIFSGGQGGIKLYEQENVGGEISFNAVYSSLIPAIYDFGAPFQAPVYNISVDLPHIGDIDNDGDLDILNFSDGSLNVFYYKNMASDLGRCDTMAMELVNRCYGSVAESAENNTVFLEHECDFNVVNVKNLLDKAEKFDAAAFEKDGMHTGGTLLSLETNGDGYPDLVIGDITNDSLILLTNSPSVLGPDSMIMQNSNFPASFSGSEKINFYEFPGVYHEDVNNDGVRDLISSPFSRFSSIDDFSSWLYLNEGTDENPNFILERKDWLQNEMLEHGTNAMPVIFDYNSDGLGDLVIGNKETIYSATESESSLRLYENIGTANSPEFTLRDLDWLGVSALGLKNVYPAFGDLDGDGDMDMILGESLGTVHYFENSAGAGNPVDLSIAELSVVDAFGEDIDPGQDVIPQLLDLDEDGLLDLILGEQWGNINFYKNIGTTEDFSFQLINEELGEVWVDNVLGIQGNNVPHFYKNNQDEWVLLTGNELGTIHRWNEISGNLDGVWNKQDSAYVDINVGQFSAPFIYDINGDSSPDLFLGNLRGGLTFYKGQFFDGIEEAQNFSPAVNIYPNPSNGLFSVEFSQNEKLPREVKVLNMLGVEVYRAGVSELKQLLNLEGYSSGMYYLLGEYELGVFELGKLIIE